MSETMLQRVTKAIDAAKDPDDPTPSEWLARAAIEVMREPTEAVLVAGSKVTLDDMDEPCREFAIDAWHVMIDAALSEQSA